MLSNPAAPTEPLWVSEWSPSLLKPGFQSLSQKRPHYFLNTPVTPWKMNWFSSNWYTKPFLTPRLKNVTLLKVYYCLHWYTLPVSFWHWSFASTSWTPLAEDEAADWIQAGSACLSLPSWLAPPYLASDLQRVTILSVATLRRREGGATLLTSGSQSCVGCRQPEIRCTELWSSAQ